METFLHEMADWMKINGEAIFGTRPWTIYGEGPSGFKGLAFRASSKFTSKDIRFTRKGNDIYAITLGLPTGTVVIRALAAGSPLVTGEPTSVTLLGGNEKLQWNRTGAGIVITPPATLPCKSALCFKISGLTTAAKLTPATLQAFRDQVNKL